MTDDGERIAGRYRLITQVGRGAMGVVWQAWDERLRRPVALKLLRTQPELTEQEREQATSRAMREARITARLQHPSIVPVYEAGRWPDGEPFYAMKLVSGRSLAHLIDSARSLGDRLAAGDVDQHFADRLARHLLRGMDGRADRLFRRVHVDDGAGPQAT